MSFGSSGQREIAYIGTREYDFTNAQRVAVGATSAQSTAISGSRWGGDGEALLHASVKCYIVAGDNPTATTSGIPLEIGEKFHIQINRNEKIAVIRDSADGFLNIVPVVYD